MGKKRKGKNTNKKTRRIKKHHIVLFSKFGLTSILFAAVNLLILYALTDVMKMYYIVSAAIAYYISYSGNFMMNKKWTFNELLKESFFKKYIKFLSINMVSVIVNLSVLFALTDIFKIYYLFSQTFAMLIGFIINFSVNTKYTFDSPKK